MILYVFLFNQLQNIYAANITEMIFDFEWDFRFKFTTFQKSAVKNLFMHKQNKNKKSPILRKSKVNDIYHIISNLKEG